MTFLTEISQIDVGLWSEFIETHPQGNFYQSYEFFQAINSTKFSKAIIIILANKNEYLGVILAQIQEEKLGPLNFLSRRAIIQGGPLVKNNRSDLAELLISKYEQIAKRKVVYSQIRNLNEQGHLKDVLSRNGFYFEEHLNILINLKLSKEQLWSEVHSKRRNEIRRASKEGTTFSVREDIDSINETYLILKQVYKRARLPLPELSFFTKIFESLGPKYFKVFIALNNGKIIGTMFALCFKDRIYDWYAGSFEEFYNKYPNDLIPWEVFMWAKESGYSVFDFGGAGKPGVPYGVRDYKKKFGGDFVDYGRYERVNKPVLFKIAETGFKIWKFLR